MHPLSERDRVKKDYGKVEVSIFISSAFLGKRLGLSISQKAKYSVEHEKLNLLR